MGSYTLESRANKEHSPIYQYYEDMAFIPELQVEKGRPMLYFLVPSGVAYMNWTDDPWFSATTKLSPTSSIYIPDEPAGVVGCITERKICNPKLSASEGCLDLYTSGEAEFARIFPAPQDRMSLRPLSIVIIMVLAGCKVSSKLRASRTCWRERL